jgi:hypothetical protein
MHTKVLFITLLLCLLNACSKSENTSSKQDLISRCFKKGIEHFKDIGSYPTLSTGKSADKQALERCKRTFKAFDL